METLVPSKTPSSFFSSLAADQKTLNTISLEMIAPQNRPANVLQLIAAVDAVGISSVNIPAGAQYCDIDTGAIAKAQAAGAKNVTSVETTHGVIRSKWPDASFIYVTAIPNRVCHFPDEAMSIYAQEFPSSHNAGVALIRNNYAFHHPGTDDIDAAFDKAAAEVDSDAADWAVYFNKALLNTLLRFRLRVRARDGRCALRTRRKRSASKAHGRDGAGRQRSVGIRLWIRGCDLQAPRGIRADHDDRREG
jgi:hypothetical protein